MQLSAAGLAFNTNYSFLVWAFTMLLPASLFFGAETVQHGWRSGLFSGGITLVLSTVFSLPALLLNLVICPKIAESNLKISTAKAFLIAIGLGLIGITFGVFILMSDKDTAKVFLLGFSAYGSASLIAGAVFSLRRQP